MPFRARYRSDAIMTKPWITIIGIGDDGLQGLTPDRIDRIMAADVLVGGDRHQALVPDFSGERLTWEGGLDAAMDRMETLRGRKVVVIATGDPMCYGAGANLQRRFGADEIEVHPHPGAFSLAAARMRWSLPDSECFTIHGRPVTILNFHIQPKARLIALSRDGTTAAEAARILTARGFGDSRITALEHLGGPSESRVDGIAADWGEQRTRDLNTLCIECIAGPGAVLYPRVPGLDEDLFEHDGQITKREVRAITLSALGPMPGELLWDIGAGSGSVAIEWMRANRNMRAAALEKSTDRAARIRRNADALGTPKLDIQVGVAPGSLTGLPEQPDAVFIGGGLTVPGLLDACFDHLKPGGRMVANGVTTEGAAALHAFHARHGGALTRIAISRAAAVGTAGLHAYKAMMEVTQLKVSKS